MNRYDIPEPLNAEERYLYGICIRLDDVLSALLKMMPLEEPVPVVASAPVVADPESRELDSDQMQVPNNWIPLDEINWDSVTKQVLTEQLALRGMLFSKTALRQELIDLLQTCEQ